jgi:hypothetical protein
LQHREDALKKALAQSTVQSQEEIKSERDMNEQLRSQLAQCERELAEIRAKSTSFIIESLDSERSPRIVELTKKYEDMSVQFQLEKAEHRKSKAYLSYLLQEIEQKIPIFKTQQSDFQQLMKEKESYKQILDHYKKLSVDLEKDKQKLQKDLVISSKMNNDLTEQLQNLLSKSSSSSFPFSSNSDAMEVTSSEGVSSSNVISVDDSANGEVTATKANNNHSNCGYQSIDDVIKHNHELLKRVHELTEDIRLIEKEKHHERYQHGLEEIKKLNQQIQAFKDQINNLQSSKDSYKLLYEQLLSSKLQVNNTNNNNIIINSSDVIDSTEEEKENEAEDVKLQELRQEFENEREAKQKEIKELYQQLETIKNEELNIRLENTKLRSQYSALIDRHNTFLDNLKLKEQEITFLQNQSDKNKSNAEQYQRQFIESESKHENMRKQKIIAEEKLEQSLSEMNYLKSKLETSEKEREKLIAEAKSIHALFDSVSSTSTGADIAYQRKIDKLTADYQKLLESLEATKEEMIQLQANHLKECESYDSRLSEKEAKVLDVQKELALSVERERAITKEKETIQTRTQTLENTIAKLTDELENAKGLINRPEQSEHEIQSQLRLENKMLSAQIISLQEEASNAKEMSFNYQKIATEKENEFHSIQLKCNQLIQEKLNIEKQFLEEKEKLSAQVARLQVVEKSKLDFIESIDKERAELFNKLSSLDQLRQLDMQKINSLQETQEQLQGKISELSAKYKSSQDMYQSEVKQHYLDVEELSSLRKLVASKTADLSLHKEELEKLKEEKHHFDGNILKLKEEFAKRESSMRTKIDDLEKSNNVLRLQVSKISQDAQRAQDNYTTHNRNENIVDGDYEIHDRSRGGDDDDEKQSLREIVGTLRREKEILACRLDVATLELSRFSRNEYSQSNINVEHQKLQELHMQQTSQMKDLEHEISQLKAQLLEMNITKESNDCLRDEVKSMKENNTKLQNKLIALNKKLKAQLAVKSADDAKIQSLESEVALLKSEHEKITEYTKNVLNEAGVQDFKSTIQRLEVEKQKLEEEKQKIEEDKQKHLQLNKKFRTALNASETKSKSLQEELASLRVKLQDEVNLNVDHTLKISSLQTSLQDCEKEKAVLQSKYDSIISRVRSKQTQSTGDKSAAPAATSPQQSRNITITPPSKDKAAPQANAQPIIPPSQIQSVLPPQAAQKQQPRGNQRKQPQNKPPVQPTQPIQPVQPTPTTPTLPTPTPSTPTLPTPAIPNIAVPTTPIPTIPPPTPTTPVAATPTQPPTAIINTLSPVNNNLNKAATATTAITATGLTPPKLKYSNSAPTPKENLSTQ